MDALETFPEPVDVPPEWTPGGNIRLTIERGGKTFELVAPVVHWTPQAWLVTNFGSFGEIWDWLMTLLLFGTGAYTFLRRPGNLSARFLLAFGLANLSINLTDSVPDFLPLIFDQTAGYAKLIFGNVVFAYLLAPSFLGFTLTFPRPKQFVLRWPLWLALPYLVGLSPTVLLFVNPDLATIGFLLTMVLFLLSIAALVHTGLTTRDAISRAQLRWAVGGVIIGVVLFLLNFAVGRIPVPGGVIEGIASLGLPVVGMSLSIAIFRYRLFDIDVVIRRTLQYTILTAALLLVYFGGIVLLQAILGPLSGDTNSPLITVISTLGIASLFNPLRIRIQAFIDRRFFRRKYDAEQALEGFARVSRDEVDLERLSAALVSLVEDTMQPERASLYLRQTGAGRNLPAVRDAGG